MEKDVLIDILAEAIAFVAYREQEGEDTTESIRLMEIRDFIYSSSPEKIDFDKIQKEINELKKPYLNEPIRLI
jgi:hypothetical protein